MRLKCKAYTWDENLPPSNGVFSAEEWSRTRRARELSAVYEMPTDENYRKAILARPDKVELTNALCEMLDFRSIKTIGEIGGAPYIQAQQITSRYPALRYLATDQDASTNEVLSRVPLLRDIEIQTFDIKNGNLSHFDDADWLVSFAVDYALDDEDILRLLRYLREKGKSWALLSVSIADLPRYLRLQASYFYRKLTGRKQRFHGWERSIGWYVAACKSAGLRLEYKGQIGNYHLLWISA